jgi:TolB-like protein/Flp pilus assembly protein TadD
MVSIDPWTCGSLEVWRETRKLVYEGSAYKIGNRAFDLLLFLVENRDRIVSKSEIFEKVWPGVVVEENNLTVQISSLRKILGSNVIVTFSGRGYRFLAGSIQNASVAASDVSEVSFREKPSVAVMPFLHLASDKSREYFTDGITDDITTELSRFRSLFVISRQSSFSFKNQEVDVRVVAQKLGVRYVVEGSVRLTGVRVRIKSQLTDALTGRHVWIDSYDGALDELFSIQDEIVARISVAVSQGVELHEYHRLRVRPAHWGAYEIAVEALELANNAYNISDQVTPAIALSRANEALALDEKSFTGLTAKAFSLWLLLHYNLSSNRDETIREALCTLEKLEFIEGNNSAVHVFRGMVLSESYKFNDGLNCLRKAYSLNPNNIKGLGALGLLSIYTEDYESAIDFVTMALRLSPVDPWEWGLRTILSLALSSLGDYEQALIHARLAVSLAPKVVNTHVVTAIACIGLNDFSSAAEAINLAVLRSPTYLVKRLSEFISGCERGEQAEKILNFILQSVLLLDRELLPESLLSVLNEIEMYKLKKAVKSLNLS